MRQQQIAVEPRFVSTRMPGDELAVWCDGCGHVAAQRQEHPAETTRLDGSLGPPASREAEHKMDALVAAVGRRWEAGRACLLHGPGTAGLSDGLG